ncbi:MAG: hypothetical protein AB1403_18950, partial [Candidatus Riflebacteria bacterium]
MKHFFISNLNNQLWLNHDFMALALITDINPDSISVIPVHQNPEGFNIDDLIITRSESGISFDLIIPFLEPVSLPATGLGNRKTDLNDSANEKIALTLDNWKKKSLGISQASPAISGKWRSNFIHAFEEFRTACWQKEFFSLTETIYSMSKPDFLKEFIPAKSVKTFANPLQAKSSCLKTNSVTATTSEWHQKLIKLANSL